MTFDVTGQQHGIWVNGSGFRSAAVTLNPAVLLLTVPRVCRYFSRFRSRDAGLDTMISLLGIRTNRLCFLSNNRISLPSVSIRICPDK